MQINLMSEGLKEVEYSSISVSGTTDYNGTLAAWNSNGVTVYGCFFKPDPDGYNGVVFPWAWTADPIVCLHAMDFTGQTASGVTVKGTLNIITAKS